MRTARWLAQLVFTAGKSHGKRLLALGRAAAVVTLAYLAWSWNAGDASVVWESTVRSLPSVSAGVAAFAPDVPPEFWKHAAMTAGVWMTVGTFVPDHVQRMASTARAARSMIFALPPLAGVAALMASSLAQAPNLALYPAVLVACLVANASTNAVGPISALREKGMGPKGAAFALALVVAAAAYAVPTWRQVVAAASWVVGVGSLLVAPAAGVVVADYWLCRDRFVDREELADGTPGGAYYYGGGVNARALLAVLVGAAPGVVEICRNFAAAGGDVASLVTGYVLNSEYSSLISTAAAFTAYLLFTLVSTPESLKEARAEAAAMTEEERLARREAAEAAEEARLAREPAAREAEYYVDGADATARASAASSARRVETTSRSDGVDEETTEEVTTTTEEVVVGTRRR